ncbi:MAG: hypothetical protein NTY77_09460 [Elusimicrobia bacterium]|nr:hypothetical protein [Elusimicrobiota bacterium]
MNIIKIKQGNDPFKKYWWVILLGFAGVGAWVCMPLMDTSVGSGSVRAHGLKSENQSLDSMANPSGAPGQAVDLSMDNAYGKKKADGESMSSLYQAPPEAATGAAAPGAPLTGSASFADALKDVSRKTEASASWGGAKPQVPFTPPKGNFSSLSGMGGSGGSGASSGPSVSGAFGTSVAKTGFAQTRGLGPGDSGAGQGGKPIMNSLKGAASQGQAALTTKSADAARAMSGASFDGSRGGSAIGGGPGTAQGGAYTGFDAVPANLKANDPNANVNKMESVPGKFAAPAVDEGEQMRKAIMMMVISAVVGGVVTGVVGSVFGGVAGGAANSATTAAMANQIDPTHGQQTIH